MREIVNDVGMALDEFTSRRVMAIALFGDCQNPRVVVIDEPTRGIDIGAKQQIYRFIAALAAEGRSVIVISSEMAELIGICHRIIVMRNGRVVGEVVGEGMSEHAIVVLATGVDAKAEGVRA